MFLLDKVCRSWWFLVLVLRLGLKFAIVSRMPLSLYLLLMVNLAVYISAEPVYSYGSRYGSKPGNLTEAESTTATSKRLLPDVSCSGVKGQGPCFEMVSTSGSNDSSFQAASYDSSSSGVASQGSRHGFMQLGDAYGSPVFASSLNSSPSVSGSNAEYDPRIPRIVSYGSVYRLLKPHGAYTSSRTVPLASYKPPIASSVTTSMSVPNGQNGYKVSHDATQLGDAYQVVAATNYLRNKPSLSNMAISSGPMIKFIMPNQSNYQLVQTINKAQSSSESGAPSKPLVTVDQPTVETYPPFEHSQGMNNKRPTSQPPVPNGSGHQSPQTLKPITAPKPQLISENPSTLQSRTTEPRFTQLGNAYSSMDTTYKPSGVFNPAQTSYMQQIAKPVQSSLQIADIFQDVVNDSSSNAIPLSGSVYMFTRPGYVHGTSVSTGTSMHMPSSSAKKVQSNYMKHFYQAGLSFPKVGYGSALSAVASGDSRNGFEQSGTVYGSADNAYNSNSQPTSSSSSSSQNPYFIAKQAQSLLKPLQPNYKSFPTRYIQMPLKRYNIPVSQKVSVQDSEQLNQMNPMLDDQAVTSEGFQTWHHYGSGFVSDPVQNSDQVKRAQKPDSQPLVSIPSHPYKPKSLFDYLSSLPLLAEQSVSSAPLIVSQGSVGLAMPRSVSDPLSNVVDQSSYQSGVLANPSQQFLRPLSSNSQSGSPESWYGPSQPDSGFALRGTKPVTNFQKVSFTRPLHCGPVFQSQPE
ncbi:hypothetical protein AMELA_G00006850 [Ameiurus melas]|uniref:Uncharacterized protein n=1 Tax=Ameiurus melas TaxID=219545 RepID=A0A7J6BJP6_AMEME|nr:hypothetical protein AMELA_G00006850 [Ameiurus melas]